MPCWKCWKCPRLSLARWTFQDASSRNLSDSHNLEGMGESREPFRFFHRSRSTPPQKWLPKMPKEVLGPQPGGAPCSFQSKLAPRSRYSAAAHCKSNIFETQAFHLAQVVIKSQSMWILAIISTSPLPLKYINCSWDGFHYAYGGGRTMALGGVAAGSLDGLSYTI